MFQNVRVIRNVKSHVGLYRVDLRNPDDITGDLKSLKSTVNAVSAVDYLSSPLLVLGFDETIKHCMTNIYVSAFCNHFTKICMTSDVFDVPMLKIMLRTAH